MLFEIVSGTELRLRITTVFAICLSTPVDVATANACLVCMQRVRTGGLHADHSKVCLSQNPPDFGSIDSDFAQRGMWWIGPAVCFERCYLQHGNRSWFQRVLCESYEHGTGSAANATTCASAPRTHSAAARARTTIAAIRRAAFLARNSRYGRKQDIRPGVSRRNALARCAGQ